MPAPELSPERPKPSHPSFLHQSHRNRKLARLGGLLPRRQSDLPGGEHRRLPPSRLTETTVSRRTGGRGADQKTPRKPGPDGSGMWRENLREESVLYSAPASCLPSPCRIRGAAQTAVQAPAGGWGLRHLAPACPRPGMTAQVRPPARAASPREGEAGRRMRRAWPAVALRAWGPSSPWTRRPLLVLGWPLPGLPFCTKL